MDDWSRRSRTDRLAVATAAVDEVASGPEHESVRDRGGHRDDDSLSFGTFYEREMPRLVALAQALAGPSVADDLAQDAMIIAYRRWREISTYDDPRTWVRRVCANAAVSLLRRRAAEARALVRLSARTSAVSQIDLDEPAARFWAHVRQLPRRQAQAIALRYIYDLEVADIAETMGCSVGTVKVHLSRARSTLASRLSMSEEDQA